MIVNGLEIKVGTIVRFMKHGEEYVGQVDYIQSDFALHGNWGEEVLFPREENFSILRTYDGKLTDAGIAYNRSHPGHTV